jgi:predicted aldo/keto reductase-like oxidoreductase
MGTMDVKGTGKLGFGLMRLPRIGDTIDVEQTGRMADAFLEAGLTYFDTAYVYGGSEEATKKALVQRHPRESYTLASKLHAGSQPTAELARKELDTSLERLGTDYLDYYLLHALDSGNYKRYEEFGLWDFVKEEKAKGRIRHYGFSFHSTPELLDKILTAHPDAEFVQLQINYADWENPDVQSRACYEVARKHGKPIVVMEPVKGGALANPPEAVKKIFDAVHPDMSYASWAIRFVASLDGILTVLSGMSNIEQMENNLSYMKDFKPLDEKEMEAIHQAMEVFHKIKAIPCTACHYCTDGCPMNIPIPEIFAAMNLRLRDGALEKAQQAYNEATEGRGRASECIGCGQCQSMCPQHLEIISLLQECAEVFEA